MKRKPIRPLNAWCVVDVDGSIRLGLVFHRRADAVQCARHPKRRVVRLYVREVRK